MTGQAWRHHCGVLNDGPADLPRTCWSCCVEVEHQEDIEAVYELVPLTRTNVSCEHCGARLVGVVCADCGTRAIHANGHE